MGPSLVIGVMHPAMTKKTQRERSFQTAQYAIALPALPAIHMDLKARKSPAAGSTATLSRYLFRFRVPQVSGYIAVFR